MLQMNLFKLILIMISVIIFFKLLVKINIGIWKYELNEAFTFIGSNFSAEEHRLSTEKSIVTRR